jgi:hypothetical protein
MKKITLNGFIISMLMCTSAIAASGEQGKQALADQILFNRAFEVALWAMPGTDSFGTREAVIRDLGGKPNDVVINTRPMDSDPRSSSNHTGFRCVKNKKI